MHSSVCIHPQVALQGECPLPENTSSVSHILSLLHSIHRMKFFIILQINCFLYRWPFGGLNAISFCLAREWPVAGAAPFYTSKFSNVWF
jgi:hypothetical protein